MVLTVVIASEVVSEGATAAAEELAVVVDVAVVVVTLLLAVAADASVATSAARLVCDRGVGFGMVISDCGCISVSIRIKAVKKSVLRFRTKET